jgi:hypothetical protein
MAPPDEVELLPAEALLDAPLTVDADDEAAAALLVDKLDKDEPLAVEPVKEEDVD